MATYYTSGSSNDRENLPSSFPESQFLPGSAMMYVNPAVSYSDAVAIATCSVGEGTEDTVSASQERQVLSGYGGSSQIQEFGYWKDHDGIHPMSGGTGILRTGQGLSLSLGSQILPSALHQMNNQSVPYRGNPNLAEQTRSYEYAEQVFSGGNPNQYSGGSTRTIPNSKYLKAAQQLLDEVVNVRKALKPFQPDGEKNDEHSGQKQVGSSKEGSGDTNQNPPGDVSQAERQELQSKLTKLLSMLDEVDRRYKQYYHQMQIVVSSFDVIAGCGAAKPYTALALQTISRHFRCLRDAISGQIFAARKSLGDQDGCDSRGVGISRLRYVDQQLRQQRTLQQLGVMQQPHAWRPQRGLPENSVLILRAWLFEHFLHPYPKDSDKIMLARQTGLSRSQVSNWFINARVRLWKPMVEEMYKEEFTEVMENESNSSSENTPKTGGADETRPHSDDQAQDSITQDKLHGSRADNTFQTGYGQGSDAGGANVFHDDPMIHVDQMGSGGRFVATASSSYNVMEMGRFGSGGGSGVSLTLGLQNSDGRNAQPVAGGFSGMRGDEIYGSTTHGAEFEYININPGHRQNRLSHSQL
ncbi:PREDICTED: BEL1-like homeodomain protein 6 [Tarenaya hassleriana]|uniref:BEL1-like homeodomain protein 6 n=1 Tax=Tarenaya hassleriana TaxID=28532 RepID=UPI00053C589C|nr:PREDICTED: BEL1-like homeodomain protein 6 [Tarenaya hassleriana]XP_019058751.1 PREDICTED: BEL1-like homeodomain protein 6 [Tarenaya hassleriana]